jgi:NAD(P)H-flavin reductase/ferredoxin
MAQIQYDGETYGCNENESVLDALLRQNIQVPHGCKSGVCQSCMMRSVNIMPPVAAQKGLKDTLQHQRYFLACQCYPDQDLEIATPTAVDLEIHAQILAKEMLNAEIVRLKLAIDNDFEFLAGQFVNLRREDGLSRSYSIANTPVEKNRLEFHIRRLPGGKFSTWIADEAEPGATLTVSSAKGDCHYLPGQPAQPLLLIGTGSGLAPLYGVLKDALNNGHHGPIHLFHGSRHAEGLYLVDEMREIAGRHSNFNYTPCVSAEEQESEFSKGRATDLALSALESLKGWKVFLCGHPDMVNQTKMAAFMKGASFDQIYADPFYAGT